MKKLFGVIGLLGLLLAAAFPLIDAQQHFQTLDKISVQENTVTMTLSGDTKFQALKLENPPRIVIDFTNTEHNLAAKEIPVNGAVIKRIRSGQFKNEPVKLARVVVELGSPADYELRGAGKTVTLSLTTDSAREAASVPPAAARPAATKENNATAAAKSAEAAAPAKAIPAAAETPAEATTAAPESKNPPKTVEVIAEPVAPVPTPKAAKKAPPVVPAAPAAKETVKKETPKAKAPAPQAPKRLVLPATPITLDFEEADIRDVLRILSIKSGINIIYGNDVTGTITLRLENVPFDSAFDTILSLKGLVSQEQGANILRIATPQRVAEERSQAVTFTKIFPLNYAKADEVKSNLDSIRTAEGRRGNISVDARTNSLIITDTPDGLLSVENIIAELDRKPQQVIIEAKIVEIVLNKSLDLGIQWAYAQTLSNDPNQTIGVGVSRAATSDEGTGASAAPGAALVTPLGTAFGGTGVTFPAAPVSGQISSIAFGLIANQMRLNAVLTALSQKGLSKLLSNPKVTTINNQQARILVGQRIPYTTTTVTVTGSTQQTNFLDVGVKLTVTPTINADKKITLSVRPEVSLFVRADPAGPVIGTREAQTTVLVSDGETVVIGGLITEDDRKLANQVPLLGDLPVIGHLFKRDLSSKDRTELLVFITPHVITE